MRTSAFDSPALLISTVALLAACANPAVEARIEALGEEPNPDLQDFQYHRPGQPCVLCHGEYEEEEPIMSLGGTIYQRLDDAMPVDGAKVIVYDSSGDPPRTATTNCVGNFWFAKEDYDPLFPVHVEVRYPLADGTERLTPMNSRIGRDGSCASCHVIVGDKLHTQSSPGRVFCTEDPTLFIKPVRTDCPVPPPLPGGT